MKKPRKKKLVAETNLPLIDDLSKNVIILGWCKDSNSYAIFDRDRILIKVVTEEYYKGWESYYKHFKEGNKQ